MSAADAAPRAEWLDYDFAVLRAVPHPHVGTFVPVGVVMHARRSDYLRLRALTDSAELARRLPDVDAELLARYLRAVAAVCEGRDDAGPIALVPSSERFHWITAPRSDVIQCGPVHEGVCHDLESAHARLYDAYVRADG